VRHPRQDQDGRVRLGVPTARRSSVGTGKLVFAIRTYLRGRHNEEWDETHSNPLENRLPQIIDRLFEGARILKAWHIEREQQQERWQQEAAQRAERKRLAKQEQSRREKPGGRWVTSRVLYDPRVASFLYFRLWRPVPRSALVQNGFAAYGRLWRKADVGQNTGFSYVSMRTFTTLSGLPSR
jgi:hypothetical protein